MSNDKKDIIADAAMTCFLSSGYGATSVDQIARSSGFSKGGIYWHFKSKEDIFIYLVEKWVREFDSGFIARLKEKDSAREKLNKFMMHFLDNVGNNVPGLIMEFSMQAKNEQVINRVKSCIDKARLEKIIKDIIQDAIHKGEFKLVDAGAATDIFISIFHGIGFKYNTGHRDKQFMEHTGVTALDIFLEGILKK